MGVRTIGVAIAIPEPHGTELQDWREHFGDPMARSIPTHVTLLPPTQVPDEALPEIETHLRSIAAGATPFDILLPILGVAARRRYAKVRFGMVIVVSLLRAVGIFRQPLWVPAVIVFVIFGLCAVDTLPWRRAAEPTPAT